MGMLNRCIVYVILMLCSSYFYRVFISLMLLFVFLCVLIISIFSPYTLVDKTFVIYYDANYFSHRTLNFQIC